MTCTPLTDPLRHLLNRLAGTTGAPSDALNRDGLAEARRYGWVYEYPRGLEVTGKGDKSLLEPFRPGSLWNQPAMRGGGLRGTQNRYGRVWGTGLIVVGIVLLGVVAFLAFSIVRDPGGYYERWVPGDEVEGPEASFDWASSGLEVEFADTSGIGEAEIVRRVWDFDDGTQSTDINPSHRFTEAGEWGVALEVVDDNGLSSTAEATVEIEPGATNSGNGAIGLNELADTVVDTVEEAAKGFLVVVLVIGMFVVLTMVGGRLLRQGVRILRPLPDRINVKLRPKELEVAMLDADADTGETRRVPTSTAEAPSDESEQVDEPVIAGV